MANSMFDKLKIRGVEFSNRVWVSPMCQYSAIDGVVGEWHHWVLNRVDCSETVFNSVVADAICD